METYIKRGSVVQAEPFDPTRSDQGVSILEDDAGHLMNATITSRGRMVNVRPGDMLVTDALGVWPCDANSFAGLYQPAADALPDDAILQTGGSQ